MKWILNIQLLVKVSNGLLKAQTPVLLKKGIS